MTAISNIFGFRMRVSGWPVIYQPKIIDRQPKFHCSGARLHNYAFGLLDGLDLNLWQKGA